MYRHILIATDGSELAGKGVEHGLALATRLQARATVLTVSEPINTGFDDGLGWSAVGTSLPEFQAAREEAASRVLDGAVAQATRHGIEVHCLHVADRYAAEAIVETTERQGCDLIVVRLRECVCRAARWGSRRTACPESPQSAPACLRQRRSE